ncbi:MAG: hypothetical protein QNJ29_02895 [Rhizobiaceae bacterium]|nr:hypothetical protein [Rhizobiaceae bacterium]
MNSRSRPTGPRKTGTRAKKPATIDLEAKDVSGASTEKKEAPAKATTGSKTASPSKPLGRAGARQSAEKESSPEPEKKDEKPKASANEEPSAANKPVPAPKGRSGGGFLGGLTGAAAAIIGLGAIGQFDGAKNIPLVGSLYSGDAGQTVSAETSAEIAGLKKQFEALQSSSEPVDLTPIRDRLEKIEEASNGGSADEAMAGRLAELETGLVDVNQTLSSIAKAAEEGADASSGEVAAAIASVTQRLENLEASVGELANVSNVPSIDLGPLEARIGEIETSVSSIRETVNSNAEDVAALNSQSSTMQETVASVKASEKVARSVAVNALGAALENDDPISLAVASIESLGGKTAETERLSELAKSGVPSRSELLAELGALTNAVQNPVADTQSGGISERFWANARNLVSFRSSGPQQGDSEVAILSRVKANLENGNLTGVISEWDTLPATTKQAGQAWLEKVQLRIEAFTLYETLSNNLSAQAG